MPHNFRAPQSCYFLFCIYIHTSLDRQGAFAERVGHLIDTQLRAQTIDHVFNKIQCDPQKIELRIQNFLYMCTIEHLVSETEQ